jgi:hypothetical protein
MYLQRSIDHGDHGVEAGLRAHRGLEVRQTDRKRIGETGGLRHDPVDRREHRTASG